MKRKLYLRVTLAMLLGLAAFSQQGCGPKKAITIAPRTSPIWFGFHVLMDRTNGTGELLKEIPALARLGVNLLIVEVDYNYEYVSHPELRGDDPIPKEAVKKVVSLCRNYKIRVIPEFQSLGHQSWAEKTFPLLIKYPQFDETPGQYPNNKDIYCRSWCPLHPEVNPIIFDLYDELVEAFEADALHVGMDEVFLIASEYCPRCQGKNPADLFAKAVNDLYDHIVKKRGLDMLMWGDRLIDGVATGYGEWEASMNKTYPALDMIPKDIIVCDWHYEKMKSYPSLPLFLEKGFRVLPTSFKKPKAVRALIDHSFTFSSERMLGHLSTIWRAPKKNEARNHGLVAAAKELRRYKLL